MRRRRASKQREDVDGRACPRASGRLRSRRGAACERVGPSGACEFASALVPPVLARAAPSAGAQRCVTARCASGLRRIAATAQLATSVSI
eukprot:scaffold1652_cov394-Prasinococcus_capsulatus_cf.AAC.2